MVLDRRWLRQLLVGPALFVVMGLLYQCGGDQWAEYSVAVARSTSISGSFGPGGGYRLVRERTVGRPEGSEQEVLGFVSDAAFGPGGTVYVADASLQRIVVFSGDGRFLRTFGRSGMGPGELVSPTSLTFVGDTLFVYDARQGRISVFDTAGRSLRAFSSPSTYMRHIRAGPDQTLLMTLAADSFVIHQTRADGALVRRMIPRAPIEESLGSDVPEPGPICVLADQLRYANPWLYELVDIDLTSGREIRALRYPSEVLRPVHSREAVPSPSVRGGAVLGLVCGERFSLIGYIDRTTGLIQYDLLDPSGTPLGRLRFARDGNDDYPGFVVDIDGDSVLAFRSRPFPQVSIWHVRAPMD